MVWVLHTLIQYSAPSTASVLRCSLFLNTIAYQPQCGMWGVWDIWLVMGGGGEGDLVWWLGSGPIGLITSPPWMGYSNHPLDGICQISAWSQACHPVAYCCQLGWSDFCEKNWSLAKLCQIVVGPQFQNFFFKCCFLTHIQAVYLDHSKWGISGALKIKSGIPDWPLQAISESFSQIGQ